ncbi:MAG: hypothetical protein ACRDVL_05980 [Acidimicrobiia bacterium]
MRGPLPLLVVLAALVAGCGQESASTTLAPTTTEPAPEAVLLSYKFEPGTTFRYEVEFEQHITTTASGNPGALGEEVPGQADLQVSGVTTFTHNVQAGPDPGTFQVAIHGAFNDLTVTGTVDREPIDSGEIPDFAEMDPIRTIVTIDEQGNVLSDPDLGELFNSPTGNLGALGLPATGLDLGSLVGPSLPNREVAVGDTWSETVEEPMPFGGEPLTTNVESRVTGTDTIDGAEVFLVETISSTSAIELDLGEMMVGLFSGFMPEEATEEERAELEAMMEGLRFLMTVDPSSFLTTTWFAPDPGHALRSEASGTTHMIFDINFPDETTGDMVAFAMDMTMDQTVRYRFLDAGSA